MWLIVFTALFNLLVGYVFSLNYLFKVMCFVVSNNKGDFKEKLIGLIMVKPSFELYSKTFS